MEVLISLSEDQKEEAIVALKEIFVAYCEMKRGKGAKEKPGDPTGGHGYVEGFP